MFNLKALPVCIAAATLVACGSEDGNDGVAGNNGSDGSSGVNSLVKQVELAVGHAECRNGGIAINSGLDADGNNTLETTEVLDTQYVCTPGVNKINASDLLNNLNNQWYINSAQSVADAKNTAMNINKLAGSAKNVILFVGDGMGMSTVTAARILDGQKKGMMGEENTLSFGNFPFAGLAKTYNVDAQTPDSAGTMSAMMSGVKTDAGVLGVDEDIARGDCSTVAGNELVSALEMAEIAGMSTGVLSTARITHATPAATYAKSAERNWEDISDMTQQAKDAGCEDIASQLVNFENNLENRFAGINVNGIDVVMGGGRRHFLPNDTQYNIEKDPAAGAEGDRTDGRHLVNEWKTKYTQGTYVNDLAEFNAIDIETNQPVFALFNESHMHYEADRDNDINGEPSLTEMTSKAIQILDNNEKGFFLTVESGRIDHGHHAGNAFNALEDTIEFSNAVKAAMDLTNPEETLIIVTADHSHVFTIAGYPKRGNPILGKVVAVGQTEPAKAKDDKPYTTVGYANGRGYMNLATETDADEGYDQPIVAGRADLSAVDTTTPGFHQEATVPRSSETHAGEDVAIYAQGPGSHLVNGTNEQNLIFHIMDHANNLTAKADAAVNAAAQP